MDVAPRHRRNGIWVTLLLVWLASAAEAAPRQILLLQSAERGNMVLDRFTAVLRLRLREFSIPPVSLTEFVINPAGFPTPPDQAMVDFLRAAFVDRPAPDLVITAGGAAAALFQKHRAHLFPDAPVLYATLDARWPLDLTDRETAVAVALDPAASITEALRLLPDTENVLVAVGGGPLGTFWRDVLSRESNQFRGVRFIWPDEMPYQDMLRRASSLPPRSVIFFTSTYEVDSAGATYSAAQALADLHARANAPIFGMLGSELGRGTVGGRLVDTDALSGTAAEIAVRILAGASPATFRTPALGPGRAVFDWRELQRWGISEDRLPAGSMILFREPTGWERYRWQIIGSMAAIAAQSALIAGLLVMQAKRKRAEQSLRESEARFRVLTDSAPVMIRTSGADGLVTDFNARWLEFTGRKIEMERGHGWMDGVHPEDVAAVIEARQLAFERREPYRLEYRLRRANGEYRWVLDNAQPRQSPAGDFVGFIGSAIDITDLKTARETLSNLNRRLIDAQEQERSRLARELHDDVCQQLTVLALDLKRLGKDTPEAQALYEDVTALASHVSGISHRLHSAKLHLLGLASAAKAFCKEISAASGIAIDFAHDQLPTALPQGVAINLFRVLQEALSNAVKHSGTTRCSVTLRGTGDQLTLEVRDYGTGFDTEATGATPGIGLVSMHERLGLIGGTMSIDSKAGAGTTIRASVPLGPKRPPATAVNMGD